MLDQGADAIWDVAQQAGQMPPHCFEALTSLLQQREFLDMESSHHLLATLEHMWTLLSTSQKSKLLSILEGTYPKYKDWMSWFVISELLGEYYCNRQALEALQRLSVASDEGPRSLVPYGLEHIVRGSTDDLLAREAYTVLTKMKNDTSDQVRDEVNTSIARIRYDGSKT